MKPCPVHIKRDCCFAQFYTAIIRQSGVLCMRHCLFFILILAVFPPEMYVWVPLKCQDTFRLQSSGALMLSAAQSLADSDTMYLCLWQKAYFLSRFAVGVYVWSLCIFGFVSLSAFFSTHSCRCICVRAYMSKCGWIILSFSRIAVWGPLCVMSMHRGLYVIEERVGRPHHMEPSSFGCLSLCPCINLF